MNILILSIYLREFEESNIHVPQTIPAAAELHEIISVRRNLLMSKGQIPTLALVQDTIIGLYLLTRENRTIDYDTWCDIYVSSVPEGRDKMGDMDRRASGNTHELFSAILPPGLNYENKSGNVVIKNGALVGGVITKSSISNRPMSIPHMILRVYDVDTYIDFMTSCTRLANRWLFYASFSIGLGDCIISKPQVIEDRVIENVASLVKNISTVMQMPDGRNAIVLDKSEQTDSVVYCILNNSKEIGNKIIEENMTPENNLKLLVESGSKGTYVNIMQITALMGQQIVNGKRIWPCYLTERSLPCYPSMRSSNVFMTGEARARRAPSAIPRDPLNTSERAPRSQPIRLENEMKEDLEMKRDKKAAWRPSLPSVTFHDNTRMKYNKTQLKFPWTWKNMPCLEVRARTLVSNATDKHRFFDMKACERAPPSAFTAFVKSYFESGGFISSSLLKGLNPKEFFHHAAGGRDGLLETSCKTSTTGYLERRLTKVCEDIQVDYNHNVINTISGKIIQMNYEVDAFDTSMMWGSGANIRVAPLKEIWAAQKACAPPNDNLE